MTTQIFSIDREQVQKLNDLFWKTESFKSARAVAAASAGLGTAVAIVSVGSVIAAPPDPATSIATGVAAAINMIKAIDGIGMAAFGVALAPMGFMVTLRVLNMVLSRV